MLESKAAFARRMTWNRSTVTRYADAGKIVVTAEGLVNVEASQARLAALRDPLKEGVRQRHADQRKAKDRAAGRGGDRQDDGESLRVDPNDTSYQVLTKHRAATEFNRSELTRLELEEKQGRLVDRDEVRRLAFAAARSGRDKYLAVSMRIRAQFPEIPAAALTLIEDLHREAAEDLAKTFAREAMTAEAFPTPAQAKG
jgi:hypothetical protein